MTKRFFVSSIIALTTLSFGAGLGILNLHDQILKVSAQELPQVLPQLAGMYRINGTAPNGNPYSGLLRLMQKDRALYAEWRTSGDDDPVFGYGLVVGNLAVLSYAAGDHGHAVVYKIRADGVLDGEWTYDDGRVLPEKLTPSTHPETEADQPSIKA